MLACKALVVGGYQRKLETIARHPDVELIAVVPPSWRDPAYEMRLEHRPAIGYELVVSPLAVNGNYHLFFFPELARLLDRYRPDVLHIDEEPYNLATFLATWQASRQGIPAVFFAWQNLLRRYPPPFSWMERYVFRTAAWGIGGTESAVRVLQQKGFRGPTSAIPQFGTDPDVFHPEEGPAPDRPFTIGFAGRLVSEKGVALLIEACARLQRDFRLVILGDGPERSILHLLAGERGIADRVRIEGSVPSAEMPDRLRAMDVVVLPSVSRSNWIEQFGRTLVEAMACGVAVIGSTCGEIPSVVGDGGIIVPEGDVAALHAALEQLAADPALRRTLGARGRQRVLGHFTDEHVATATVDLYRQVASRHAARVE
jgi:glycosyltransferase involved in cell wall biosynthesis